MLLPILISLIGAASSLPTDTTTNVRDLPIVELRAAHPQSSTVAIILSGDGGWADIDEQVGKRLEARGVDVVGLDMRSYLRGGHRSPASIGADISRIARRYTALWQRKDVALVGYSRGSDLAPFAATHMATDERQRLTVIVMLTLLERASFVYHFSDLWRTTSGKDDTPVLPELEQLRSIPLVCVYGRKEKESLCRTAPTGLMTTIMREGEHHFDGDYNALGDIVFQAIMRTESGAPLGNLGQPETVH